MTLFLGGFIVGFGLSMGGVYPNQWQYWVVMIGVVILMTRLR